MELEKPPEIHGSAKRVGERRGLVLIHTGDGKGKSTAAFGLALRAHGRGKPVAIYPFMKVPPARFGEHRMFEQLGIPVVGLGERSPPRSSRAASAGASSASTRAGSARASAGVDYDERFLARLPAGVCLCGEGGEFHSFVLRAPGFAKPLAIRNGAQQRVLAAPPLAVRLALP